MLKEINWSKNRSYASREENEPIQFYLDGLNNSSSFDLLLGYFSSSAISVLACGFAKFIHSGGTMRLVVNEFLSKEDKEAIEAGQKEPDIATILDFSNIEKLTNALDDYGTHFFNCLAWLIQNNRLQIKLIKPSKGNGIAHFKQGIFADGKDMVSFTGSCNFTANGLLANVENLSCFLTWEDERSKLETTSIRNRFENYFSGNAAHVEYLDIANATIAIKEFGSKDINELLIDEKDLISKKMEALKNDNLKKAFDKALNIIEGIASEPRFPYPEGPRLYQQEAYFKWVANHYQGIFAMATGTGKTITSLNCLLNEYKKTGTYKAVIVVPTTALLEQWKKEAQKFNFTNIITVSSKEKWKDDLGFFNTASKFIKTSFIVIVTYHSIWRKNFYSHFQSLPNDTLFIADEAHNLGWPNVLKILPDIHLNKRIGLSATPDRMYDELGNEIIEIFFNDKAPYVYSYTMKQAMDIGWLCQYMYFPHTVKLNDSELQEYFRISRLLMHYMDNATGTYKKNKEVEELLLKRKRIIHKAGNKIHKFKRIIEKEFTEKGNLKYSLIYVPEGIEPNYENIDSLIDDDDDIKLINEYTKVISETDESIFVKQYTSVTKNREKILKDFSDGKIHVLTSMKCLDEGVDVPRAELAIFCSSTANPRQFIQRRGRVLRIHDDKPYAKIHDLVVVPTIPGEKATFEMERNLVIGEIKRVVDFSNLAMNKQDTFLELKEVLEYYNISLTDFLII